jgi:hypothetical protein
LLIFFNFPPAVARVQQSFTSSIPDNALPNTPEPEQAGNQSEATHDARSGTASISGTVVDASGDVLEGAQVTLVGPVPSDVRNVASDTDGQFAFTGLAPGSYKVTATGAGMSTFTSPQIPLKANEAHVMPPVTLIVERATASVTVTENKEELAEEQVHIAVQQRIGGVIPNFYSSYDWNAPPMQTKQKFKLSVRSIIDPVSFLIVAGIAGAEQYQNVFPEYGDGIEGYGKRYGAALANLIMFQATCWEGPFILQSSARTRATSTREREASVLGHCTQCSPR